MLTSAQFMSRLSLLVDLASQLAREVDLDAVLGEVCERIARALHADRATVWLVDAERGDLVARIADAPELAEWRQPTSRGIAGHVTRHGQSLRVDDVRNDVRFDPSADTQTGYTTRNMVAAPIRERSDSPVRGVVQVLNKLSGQFDEDDERYLVALATQLGSALALTTLRADNDSNPGLTLRGPLNRIVGTSSAMQEVYRKLLLAAQTDATVLLQGETGTGKGLLARSLHVNSSRQAKSFVTVDCTTLPAQLVESELFGHERGAFTGADRRVPGKVELADGGTLFIDEIGDLPLELQGKLLRFLQDRQFERVGGRQPLSADVRVVVATHRDLESAVSEGKFRQDLYYRVRVVRINVPPLRERGAHEIEILAKHFAEQFSQRHRRPLLELTPETLGHLVQHQWPGNVRELEAWIESAVVLCPDGKLQYVPSLRPNGAPPGQTPGVPLPPGLSLDAAAKVYAEFVLAQNRGNRTQAAKDLNISRNRLARLLADPSEGD